MFLHLSVSYSVHSGGVCPGSVCIPACTGHTPLRADPPGRHPRADMPPGRHPQADTPGQTLPGRHQPPGRHPPMVATAVDGMHPAGMHSCYYHPHMWIGNVFSHVCLSVCLSVNVSVCLCVCVSVCSGYNF